MFEVLFIDQDFVEFEYLPIDWGSEVNLEGKAL